MKPLKLPKSVYVGRLFRLRFDGGLEEALRLGLDGSCTQNKLVAIDGTKWTYFWLTANAAVSSGDSPGEGGLFWYPFLCRASEDRYILASTEAKVVDHLFEAIRVAGFVESPRIHVDKAARDLVFPPIDELGHRPGRRYTIGAVYGAVEGYARALRNVSFFGEDIAEAALFRAALEQISVTRLTVRDPSIDRELLSINTTGGLDFHYSQSKFLNNIDALTTFFRAHNYIEWRVGRSWQPQ